MERKNFIRQIEDFTCGHCGAEVLGTGYTNHCPKCLWSKHVDNIPGDRANSCNGLMEPIAVEATTTPYELTHRCILCGKTIRNKVADNDNKDELIKILQKS